MYYFDRDDFYQFNKGNKKCFVMPNGLGGFTASSIINSTYRKQNGYLVASLGVPTERIMLLNKINERVITQSKTYDFEAQEYETGNKEGQIYLDEFNYSYIPSWRYQAGHVQIEKKIAPIYGSNGVAITYEIVPYEDATFFFEPLFNYRDIGSVSSISDLDFDIKVKDSSFILIPKKNPNVQIKFLFSEGSLCINENKFSDNYQFGYDKMTGDDRKDVMYKPFSIKLNLKKKEIKYISIICTIDKQPKYDAFSLISLYEERIEKLIRMSRLKDSLAKQLVVASDAFVCSRNSTGYKTILAGLPWFTDWGRDTMISFTGLMLVTKRFKEAKEILKSFSLYEKNGLIPNMFPEEGTEPLYNTVDASLWYFIAAYNYIKYTGDSDFVKEDILPTLRNIINNYKKGTDFSIYMDKEDYLIHAGSDLDQVTWMDVRINDLVVTPRHGKPVEINALWYNALKIMYELTNEEEYQELANKVYDSFRKKYVNEKGYLFDVVDTNNNDDKLRPNQLYAISLPFKLFTREEAKKIFDIVDVNLYNTFGIRSLSPNDKDFKPIYNGPLQDRDLAYHQGTTWSFLIGPYLDSCYYVYQDKERIKNLVKAFIPHLEDGCINGVAEVFDGAGSLETKGCYTQAWGVGELLRAYYENYLKESD